MPVEMRAPPAGRRRAGCGRASRGSQQTEDVVVGNGNPSSAHWAGQRALAAIDVARSEVAPLLACSSEESVFTSGGSEANNLAIKGAFFAARERGNHIVTSQRR